MAHKLIVKPEAELDLVDALEWHEEQQPGLGLKLYAEISEVFDDISQNPEYYQERYREVRIRFTPLLAHIYTMCQAGTDLQSVPVVIGDGFAPIPNDVNQLFGGGWKGQDWLLNLNNSGDSSWNSLFQRVGVNP